MLTHFHLGDYEVVTKARKRLDRNRDSSDEKEAPKKVSMACL